MALLLGLVISNVVGLPRSVAILQGLIAFTAGVVVNVILGFVLSALVFGSYWESLAH